jgi:DUF1680 family protein
MGLLDPRAKYADMLELTLYNNVMVGLGLGGKSFFYQNPLASRAGRARRTWIGLACCPTNYARIIPQVGGFQYARGGDTIYINQYAAGTATLALRGDQSLTITQETEFPWQGGVRLTINAKPAAAFELALRIPSWATGRPVPSDIYRYSAPDSRAVTISIGGTKIQAAPRPDGYIRLRRRWKTGETIALNLSMPIRRVYSHEKIEKNRGLVALMRGPLLYCLEGVGTDYSVRKMALPKSAELTAEHRPDLLGGVTVIRGQGLVDGKPVAFTAIPYYAWQNRGKAEMTVWMPEAN